MADQDYPTLYADMEDAAQRTRSAAIAFEKVLGGGETLLVPVNGFPDQPTIAGRVKVRMDQLQAPVEAAIEAAKRYLGARATPPTTRADGTPIQVGDQYFNTGSSAEYIWNGSAWYVPNADGQLLAGAGGAALIGKAGGGTVQQALNTLTSGLAVVTEEVTGLLAREVADPAKYGAIADGTLHPLSERFATLAAAQAVYPHATALTDSIDWAACQAALNAGTLRVTFPGPRYILNKGLVRTTDIDIEQAGVLDFSSGSGFFSITGSAAVMTTLGGNITKGARDVLFSAAPALQPGDIFCAYNPADYSWSPHRSYYRAGEFFCVHSVTGNSVRIYGNASDTYVFADMVMYKITPVRVSWENPNLIASASSAISPAARIAFGKDVILTGPRTSGGVYAGIEIDRCYNTNILSGGVRNNSAANGDDYGIIISNSHKVNIVGGGHQATRHAIALGGGSGICAVPYREVTVSGATIETAGDDVGASDMHGNGDNIRYSNCVIKNHTSIGGRDVSFRDCKIYSRTLADGSAIAGSEIVGGNYELIDCELVISGDMNAFGGINLTCAGFLKQDLNFIVRGLTVSGSGGGSTAKLIRISPYATLGPTVPEPKKINIDVQGVINKLSTTMALVWFRNDYDSTAAIASNGIIVDNFSGPAGMYGIYPTGAGITGLPTREMEQKGWVDVVTTATGSAIAGTQDFRHPFSRMPVPSSPSVYSPTGAAWSVIGTQVPVPTVYTLSNTSIRPGILAASGSFPAGTTARLGWGASIRDI